MEEIALHDIDQQSVDEVVRGILEKSDRKTGNFLTTEERLSLIELIHRTERNPYMYYTPNGAIEKYISNIGVAFESKKKIFFLSAANGLGKTALTINMLVNLCYSEINIKWFDYPFFNKRWMLPKVFWLISEDSTLSEKIEPEIKKWFPPGRYKLSNKGRNHIYELTTDTGFQIFFKTTDQDPGKFESADLGGIFYDEPPGWEIHKACTARLREGGFIFAQLTPLHKCAWILDAWIDNEDADKYIYVQYANIWENSIERGIRGRMTTETIDFMKSQLDPEEIDARIEGKFSHLRGLVYKDFKNEPPYVIEPVDVSKPGEYQIYCMIDPHDRRYPAVTWIAIDRAGYYYVIGEWPNIQEFSGRVYDTLGDFNGTFQTIVSKIKEIEEKNDWKVKWRIMDPNKGRTPYGNTGFNVQEEFEILGMYFDVDVNNDKEVGHSKVKELLKITNFKRPKLQVFNTCKNTSWSFRRYAYDDFTGKRAHDKSAKEDTMDKGKDFMDNIRYFATSGFKFDQADTPTRGGWREKLRKDQKRKASYMAA